MMSRALDWHFDAAPAFAMQRIGRRAAPLAPVTAEQRAPRRRGARGASMRSRAAANASASGATGVLMVCLGNICRSPTAEATFTTVVERAGLAGQFSIDSCGTGGGSGNWWQKGGFSYHEGEAADARMTEAAAKRGVKLTSRSRPLTPEDLQTFDYIVCMDQSNKRSVLSAAEGWDADGRAPGVGLKALAEGKVRMMHEYCQKFEVSEVPDPYYGGAQGFETVLDLLDDAGEGLLAHILEDRRAAA